MNRSLCSLVLLLLLVPLTGLGQSYEWFGRIESPDDGSNRPPVVTEVFQVAASDYGTYSVGYTYTDCDAARVVCCPSTATRMASYCGGGYSASMATGARKPTRSPSMPPAYSLPENRAIPLS